MNINRRALFFALLASPLGVAAAHAAPDVGRNNPVIPDDVSGNAAPRRRRHDENHDESHHGRERHSSRRRSRRHRDGDND